MFSKKEDNNEEVPTRLLGNVFANKGQYGDFHVLAINTKDEYKQGDLFFKDKETGKVYAVKQIVLSPTKSGKVQAKATINLSNDFHVEEVK